MSSEDSEGLVIFEQEGRKEGRREGNFRHIKMVRQNFGIEKEHSMFSK